MSVQQHAMPAQEQPSTLRIRSRRQWRRTAASSGLMNLTRIHVKDDASLSSCSMCWTQGWSRISCGMRDAAWITPRWGMPCTTASLSFFGSPAAKMSKVQMGKVQYRKCALARRFLLAMSGKPSTSSALGRTLISARILNLNIPRHLVANL